MTKPTASPEPKLSQGENTPQEQPHTDTPARSRVRRSTRQEAVQDARALRDAVTLRTCPAGHEVEQSHVFCPECGKEISARAPHCRNGHKVTAVNAKFCPACGVSMAVADVLPAIEPARPRPDAELTEEELEQRRRQHDKAVQLGKSLDRVPQDWCPSGNDEYVFHILTDGHTAFGRVWFRGQEIRIGPGHPRWDEAREMLSLDTAAQYRRWGREVFRPGPWPGAGYTAAAGRFQRLRQLDGEGEIAQPSEEELARAEAAERARAGRVPAPLALG